MIVALWSRGKRHTRSHQGRSEDLNVFIRRRQLGGKEEEEEYLERQRGSRVTTAGGGRVKKNTAHHRQELDLARLGFGLEPIQIA